MQETFCKADHPLQLVKATTIKSPANNEQLWASIYGKLLIPSDSNIHCRWDFKIEQTKPRTCHLIFGITSNRDENIEAFHRNKKDVQYAYNTSRYDTFFMSDRYTTKLYGSFRKRYQDNTVKEPIKTISIELNLKTKELIFYVNDISQGVAFYVAQIKNMRYCMALSLAGYQQQIIIQNFTQYQIPQNVANINKNNIIYEGWLYKQSKWMGYYRKRWMVLRNDNTLSSYKKVISTDKDKETEIFNLNIFNKININSPNSHVFGEFRLSSDKKDRLFRGTVADLGGNMNEWVKYIKYAQSTTTDSPKEDDSPDQKRNDNNNNNNNNIIIDDKPGDAMNIGIIGVVGIVDMKNNDKDNDNINVVKENIGVDPTKYKKWNYNDVIKWILSIENGFFEKNYGDILKKEIKNAELDGNDLVSIDKNDMKGLGINIFKHRKLLEANIQKLKQI